jgi:4-hydroxy-2-oxoheptanedioate aldolase
MSVLNNRILSVRKALAEGGIVLNGWSMLGETTVLEAIARAGYDMVCTDYQHGLAPLDRAADHARAIEVGGAIPFARTPCIDASAIGKILDAGYAGIICPMVNSADEAQAFAAACRYPPAGARSFGPVRATIRDGAAYFDTFAPHIVRLAMIETRSGLEQLAAILAVDGIDGVYVGPSDLALSHGLPPKADPDHQSMLEMMREIAGQARAANKIAGIHTLAAEYARTRIAEGFNFITCGVDSRVLAAGCHGIVSSLR